VYFQQLQIIKLLLPHAQQLPKAVSRNPRGSTRAANGPIAIAKLLAIQDTAAVLRQIAVYTIHCHPQGTYW